MLDEGKSINEVARLVKASPSSVHRWKELQEKHGAEGLKAKPHPGRGCRLSAQDKEQLKQLLLAGPQAAGFDSALWTCSRVAQVIEQRFGVSYHPDHVGRLLHGLGFSCQYPQHQARERDEDAIRQWRLVEWPRIKKSPTKRDDYRLDRSERLYVATHSSPNVGVAGSATHTPSVGSP